MTYSSAAARLRFLRREATAAAATAWARRPATKALLKLWVQTPVVHRIGNAQPPRTVKSTQRQFSTSPPTGSTAKPYRDVPGIIHADLKQEMTRSYMEYALSVILGRAMPDVRDGLKPVHRRILFAMHELGLSPAGQFRKSARVVGEVLGKFHPHGDKAVYDALVRMAQRFSMSIPLVNGHGNFGSTDGDPAAAMRYTECKLSDMAEEVLLSDIGRETVSYSPNFDGSESEPLVLPARVPNILINGSTGIAVGIATNIPPHNLGEVVAALKALVMDPDISAESLLDLVPAPDFPTGGQIVGTDGSRNLYLTGRGRIIVRACFHAEESKESWGKNGLRRTNIVITELPYQVNKAMLISKIAALVDGKKLDGIADLRDESDRSGTRIVIELKRKAKIPVVIETLFKKTPLQTSFSANFMALDGGQFPIRLTLRECLQKFLDFRRETVQRRIKHDLRKSEERLHVVQGFLVALRQIREVVRIAGDSPDTGTAQEALRREFKLSEMQAEAVMEMRFLKLTSLEQGRLNNENIMLQGQISDFKDTLSRRSKLDSVIISELSEIAAKYTTPRRSVVLHITDTPERQGIPTENSVAASANSVNGVG